MSLSANKYHVLLLCVNPYIRIEFHDYLHSLLGDYISFDSCDPAEITDSSQYLPYQCILFSSKTLQSAPPAPVPESIHQIVCTRTFNHAFLDQIIRIPPHEKVYVVNDLLDSAVNIIKEFEEMGINQYHFIPYSGESQETDLSVHYAITVGEPQMVPKHIRNIINIGNRIIDISTVNELCVFFHLPAKLGNQITKNYISHIFKVVKTAGSHYSSFIFSQQLLMAVTSNLPSSICLLDEDGSIMIMNKYFAMDWGLPEKQGVGTVFAGCLPESYSAAFLNQTGDYRISNRAGIPMVLSVMELSFPNRSRVFLLTSKPDANRELDPDAPPQLSDLVLSSEENREASPIERQRISFLNLVTDSESFHQVLSYAKRLSLFDFPILIQGESGTQKKTLAKAIHKSSSRRNYPFISLNQLMSLAGYGLPQILDAANRGTLLVDNIEHLSLEKQDFLVQVLQNISSDSISPQKSYDIRIIATSSLHLYSLVQEGTFRKDLFFHLSTAVIDTVPLRKRKEDIPLLLEHFFRNAFHDSKFRIESVLSKSLYQFLLNYDYPGNIKELMNLAQYFYSMYGGHPLILSQLPSYIRESFTPADPKISALERQVLSIIRDSPKCGRSSILKALTEAGMNISDGKLRGLLGELAKQQLILVHRTKGGCEITEAGDAFLEG